MKSLFDRPCADEIQARISRLSGTATAQWGKMSVAQAAAHCADALEVACGDRTPPRMVIGRLLGWVIKPMVLRDDKPMRPNSPTTPDLVVADTRDFEKERGRLRAQVDRFVSGGPAGVTRHPHPFFGALTPQEFAILQYKHLDHHLRQFGA